MDLDQFVENAQYYDEDSRRWKSLENLDMDVSTEDPEAYWDALYEKNPDMELRYISPQSRQILNIGNRWNSSKEKTDVSVLYRKIAGQAWNVHLKNFDTTYPNHVLSSSLNNIIKPFFGSNLEKITDKANGNYTMEFFDATTNEIFTVDPEKFKTNSQYYDESNQTWKPFNDKYQNFSFARIGLDTGNEKFRYIDPDTKRVYQIDTRLWGHGSPILLDTDGSGKTELTSVTDGVQFDLDGDGVKEQVAWTEAKGEKTDSWLALDRNSNGNIDSGKELFGNQHGAVNGYDELKNFDNNQDGVINSQDSVYQELKMWQDKNHDGISQSDEMLSLEEAGVQEINLTYQESSEVDGFSNELRQQSGFVRTEDAASKIAQEQNISLELARQGLSVDAWLTYLKG